MVSMPKILITDMHTNNQKWLTNFLSGRRAEYHMTIINTHYRPLPNGLPQGAVRSPQLFNFFTHDIHTPNDPQTTILSYAEDITVTSHANTNDRAATHLQNYLHPFEQWLATNRFTASPEKSYITLFTPDKREYNAYPHITLNNQALPLNTQ